MEELINFLKSLRLLAPCLCTNNVLRSEGIVILSYLFSLMHIILTCTEEYQDSTMHVEVGTLGVLDVPISY
jgi:hypothetical protein